LRKALHAYYTQAGADMTPWRDETGSIFNGRVPEPMDVGFRNLAVERTYFGGREV
jgi:hypothetical protein